MRFDRLSVSVVAALLLASPLASAQSNPIPKQLSGPPAEFDAMRAPTPESTTIHSKSALLPVHLATTKSGAGQWSARIPVESGNARFVVFAGRTGAWDVALKGSNGTTEKAARRTVTELGMEQASHAGDYFSYTNLAGGTRELSIRATANAPRDGFVLLEGDARTELAAHPTHLNQLAGERIGLTAMLTAVDDGENVVLGKAAGGVSRAELAVTFPDGARRTFPMFDDGRHGDAAAADGVYGGDFVAEKAGSYLAQVVVHGTNRAGQPIVRTTEHVLPVVERTVSLAGAARGIASEDTRVAIRLPVETTAKAAGAHYRAYAEVWGRNASGAATPIAWVGGMVDAASGGLELGFDERWVARAGARGPYQLRNVRIEDPDHFVTIAASDALDLELPAIRTKAAPSSIAIDEAMTMGKRPNALVETKGVGTRLLLVHGYCSGGVW
ncbi:MAG TPA: choice-of-anchor X domain-containing protein, partial [Xanthomonadales bacterium]|nr:choice-of-anchor X domain-containing protein [Xanthomonadales bacterium]